MTALMAWECFRDGSYFDLWCVREKGERRFGHGFHLVNGDEAAGLVELLNTLAGIETGTAETVKQGSVPKG